MLFKRCLSTKAVFLIWIHSKAEQPLQGKEVPEMEVEKDLKHTGNLFRKNLQIKGVG